MKNGTSHLLLSLTLCLSAALSGRVTQAAELDELIDSGLRAYSAGKLPEARQAFEDAGKLRPDDPLVLFNRGCVALSEGDLEQAVELLTAASTCEDSELAARARFNLGCALARHAEQVLGEAPIAVDLDTRNLAMQKIAAAIAHFRGCLRAAPEHPSARRQLETLKAYAQRIREQWDRHDREQEREKLDLAKFVESLRTRQRQIRSRTHTASTAPRRASWYRTTRGLAEQQTELGEEVPYLKLKVLAELGSQKPAGPSSDQVQRWVDQVATAIDTYMDASHDALSERQLEEALKQQAAVETELAAVYLTIAAFPQIVRDGVQDQEQLNRETADRQPVASGASEKSDQPSRPNAELEWDQEQLGDLARALVQRATTRLQSADKEDDLQGLRPALELAAVKAPQIDPLVKRARQALSEQDFVGAAEPQAAIKAILREIADALPKSEQPPPQSSDQDQQQPSDGENGENDPQQDSGDSQSEDDRQSDPAESDNSEQSKAGDRNENPQDRHSQQRESEDEPSEDPTEVPQDRQEDAETKQERERDKLAEKDRDPATAEAEREQSIAERQAAVLLQKVRERQRAHREQMKRWQQILRQRVPIERDW